MSLQRENEQLKQEIRELQAALKAAEQKIEKLTALLNQNSRNSNWPSSRDKSRKKKLTRSLRTKSGKKPGGQKGHTGHTLEFKENPDVIEVHRPTHCQHCQKPFSDQQPAVTLTKRQVHDLPPMRVMVYEHQALTLVCPQCGQTSRGHFPDEVAHRVQYGPRVQQMAVYLKAEQFVPYERSRQLLADLFGISLSPGTLQNMVEKAAERLRPIVEQIKAGLISSKVVHFDESGFYIGGQRHWLHSAGTQAMTCYYSHKHRGHKATDAMDILPHFKGTAVHDFWSAYRQYEQCQHSLCNAHHLRELTAVWENDQQRWAAHFKRFLVSAKQAVDQSRLTNQKSLPQSKIDQIERIYTQLIQLALQANPPPPDGWPKGKRGRAKKTKARNLAERLDKHRHEALAFIYNFKVPFDNNLAERDIRMLKVQQKISGCFRSQTGAEDFCTIRSYISTMRKQGVSIGLALGSVFSENILMPDFTPV